MSMPKALGAKGILTMLGLGLYTVSAYGFYDIDTFQRTALASPLDIGMDMLLMVSILSLVVSIALFVILDSQRRFSLVAHRRAVLLLSAVGSIGAALLALSTVGGLVPLAVAGALMMGLGAASLVLAWGVFVGRTSREAALVEIVVAFLLGAVLLFARSFMPIEAVLVTDVAIYVLSGVLWYLASQRFVLPEPSAVESPSMGKLPWKIFIVFGLCVLISASAEAVGTNALGLAPTQYALLILASTVFAGLVLLYLLKAKNGIFPRIWPLFVLLFIGSIMLVPLFTNIGVEFIAQWITAEKQIILILGWILVTGIVFQGKMPGTFVFGTSYICIISIPSVVGGLLFSNIAISRTEMQIASSLAAFAIIVATVFVLRDANAGDESVAPATSAVSDAAEVTSSAEACEAVAAKAGLSQREGEVLALLYKGYTFERIGSELFISINTVRSHIRNIYRKLDVHTREEVLDIIDNQP